MPLTAVRTGPRPPNFRSVPTALPHLTLSESFVNVHSPELGHFLEGHWVWTLSEGLNAQILLGPWPRSRLGRPQTGSIRGGVWEPALPCVSASECPEPLILMLPKTPWALLSWGNESHAFLRYTFTDEFKIKVFMHSL